MNTPSPLQATYLKDYRAPDFFVESIDLHFSLMPEHTIVRNRLALCRNRMQGMHTRPLVLQGEQLTLLSIQLDEQTLVPTAYKVTEKDLTIENVPDLFTLEIVTKIYPHKNTALSGLYQSEKMYCTQCEAQGFRRITYYLDRPDVMAPFTTTIEAECAQYPILLSNGNKIKEGKQGDRHWVTWQDPFKKPSYLFALVAGDLAKLEDTYTTASGKKVQLEFYVEPENKGKCAHAIQSLKAAMRWDEQHYGREYDLDVYMVVAVNDFNMGAMENKGLNIFNSKYILADENTATDADFQAIEAVIGHEYFHNWTGNRITCRDWFQLSLKEGLTVFREQQFSASMGSAAVKRIEEVRLIQTKQFAEDAGPMAHPVRPNSYIEINNFYTMTIYHKGAEVIRMLHTLLGAAGFRKGMDLYFERHDGQAVTIEDFVAAFEDANSVDLNQFYRWYYQAGTPEVEVIPEYRAQEKQFVLKMTQHCPATPDKSEKKTFLIPIKVALYSDAGTRLPLHTQDKLQHTEAGDFLILDQATQTFVFDQVENTPIPSLLGDFSAPVKLRYPYTQEARKLLVMYDEDWFNRWDAQQQLLLQAMFDYIKVYPAKEDFIFSPLIAEVYQSLFEVASLDQSLLAQLLLVPSFQYAAQRLMKIEITALCSARTKLVTHIAQQGEAGFAKLYEHCAALDDGALNAKAIGCRALKNVCLSYLVRADKKWLKQAERQYHQARNMTDRIGALSAVNHIDDPMRDVLFGHFYEQFKHVPLIVNKWLALHATSELPGTLDKVKALIKHEAFDFGNPNKVYALLYTFSTQNPIQFHDAKGEGYHFIAQNVIFLNERNPQIAARLLESLTQWKRLEETHGQCMKTALQTIQKATRLSQDVYEIVEKSLA